MVSGVVLDLFTKKEEADKALAFWFNSSDWCWMEEYNLYTKFDESIYNT